MTEAPQSSLILVVDDDPMSREVMEAFLLAENYKVQLAHNGATALRLAPQVSPDLVILDVKMPDMTGYEVCKTLKRNRQTSHIPVLMVSGFDAYEDKARGIEAGADAYLTRPFKGDDFIEHVSRLLR